ncbi:MAG: ribonuclease domain-containing protein [Casimicrobiaceae bacterium]
MVRIASIRGRVIAAAAALAVGVLVVPAAVARTSPGLLPEIALADLPPEARAVNARIRTGGPFRYDRDGVVFGNYEKILPANPRGHYHEYTVPTPGVKNRGARRIICGGPPKRPDTCWYTSDHYRSFREIRE